MKKYLLLLIFCITTTKISANEIILNQKIIGDIEKHLFFNNEVGDIEQDDTSTSDQKNTMFNEEEYKPQFDIIAIKNDFDDNLAEKKKLAYNTNLIGHYEIAITLYKEILKNNKDDSSAKFGLAFAYQNLYQYTEAKNLYYELLKSGTKINKDEIVSNLLSIIIEEDPKEAIFFLTRLSAQHPESADLIAKSSLTYEKINKPERAVSLMKKALSLDPANFQYQYNLAVMLDKAEKYGDAKDIYDAILLKLSRSESEKLGISLDEIYKRSKYLDSSL